jgi:hypothetical protein
VADKLSVEEQIALILKKAESATPAEAEMLTERAATLMARFSIDEAMLDAKRSAGVKQTPVEKYILVEKGIYMKAWQSLAFTISYQMNVRVLWRDNYDKTATVIVMGFAGDIEQYEKMFKSLMLQAIVAMRAWWSSYPHRISGSVDYQARRGFLVGFGDGASTLLRKASVAALNAAKSDGVAGTDLVLVNRRNEVDAFVAKKHPKTRSARGVKVAGGGYGHGHDAGKNANVGQKRTALPR